MDKRLVIATSRDDYSQHSPSGSIARLTLPFVSASCEAVDTLTGRAFLRQQEDQMAVVGRFIVADPAICHGKPTFKGTRIMVSQVLDQVAEGLAWESIIERWDSSISREAIAEAVRMARDAFLSQDLLRSG
jgi:uncharacterized protein (DUF433 family)